MGGSSGDYSWMENDQIGPKFSRQAIEKVILSFKPGMLRDRSDPHYQNGPEYDPKACPARLRPAARFRPASEDHCVAV